MENTSGKKPLIMAYIGKDDPMRGDSKGSIGLARLVAEMMNGQYVYVDKEMLDKNFPDMGEFSEKLKKYVEINGHPDIAIGSDAHELIGIAPLSSFIVDGFNEHISRTYHNKMREGLVSHHLTTDILQKAGEEFSQRYPQIKGELIGIMLGGESWSYGNKDSQLIANKLKAIADQYNTATLFICPSRRSGDIYKNIMKWLRQDSFWDNDSLSNIFSQAVFRVLSFPKKYRKLHVIGTSYESIKAGGFNPYLGLLAKADHLMIIGNSHSLVSEALFTGKNIYGYDLNQYPELENLGYISSLEKLSPWKKLPTKPMPALNISHEVAEGIVRDYQKHLEDLKNLQDQDFEITDLDIPSLSGTMPTMDF